MRRRTVRLAALLKRLTLLVTLAFAGLATLPAVADAFVYWTNDATGTIGRADLDGTDVDESFIPASTAGPSGSNQRFGVAVGGGHIYWADADGRIGRANVNGSGVNNSFIAGANGIANFALRNPLAVGAGHIYWVSNGDGTSTAVGRANLDGSGVNKTFITANADSVAADSDHVYWTKGGGTIGRANADGSGVDDSFIAGAGNARGIAVDARHIYWQTDGSIGRANLDGSVVDPSFISGAGDPFGVLGLAVDEHIYWGDHSASTIGRANLDGTGINQSFISAGNPWGIAVDSLNFPPQTTIDSGPDGTTSDNTPTFAFSSDEPGSSFECRLDSGAWASCTSPTTVGPLADGAHTFAVRATDTTGNTDPSPASRSFTVDATPPNTTITSGPAGLTNDATPTFAFSSDEPGSSFECRLDGGSFSSCSSPKMLGPLADGRHTFKVRSTDQAGNTDPTSANRSFAVDTIVEGSVSAKKTQKQKRTRILVKVRVKAKEDLRARGKGKIQVKRKRYKLKPQSKSVASGEQKTLKLKPKKRKDAKKIAKALQKGKKATAKLTVKLSDGARNTESETLRVKLKG
jgi:hypothetical protein